MPRSTLLFLLVSMAASGWPAAASAASPNDTYPFHGVATATPVIIGTCPPGPPANPPLVVPIEIEVEGTGVFTRLGSSRVVVEETAIGLCVGGPVPAPIAVLTAVGTYTAADGDQLVAASVSTTPITPIPGTPLLGFTSIDEVQPTGTGRFAGAGGTLSVDVTFDPTVIPIAARFTVEGELTIPKD